MNVATKLGNIRIYVLQRANGGLAAEGNKAATRRPVSELFIIIARIICRPTPIAGYILEFPRDGRISEILYSLRELSRLKRGEIIVLFELRDRRAKREGCRLTRACVNRFASVLMFARANLDPAPHSRMLLPREFPAGSR